MKCHPVLSQSNNKRKEGATLLELKECLVLFCYYVMLVDRGVRICMINNIGSMQIRGMIVNLAKVSHYHNENFKSMFPFLFSTFIFQNCLFSQEVVFLFWPHFLKLSVSKTNHFNKKWSNNQELLHLKHVNYS